MQQTINPISEEVTRAKSNFERFSGRILHLLSFIPDDKLTWKPSPTAKTPLNIVAHCALVSKFCADVITVNMPDSMPSPQEFLKGLHEAEEKVTTRESAIALLNETTAELSKAFDGVNVDNIDSTRNSPFGAIPIRFWISQGGEQMAGHAGQLEYLQTIWGDLDNHLG